MGEEGAAIVHGGRGRRGGNREAIGGGENEGRFEIQRQEWSSSSSTGRVMIELIGRGEQARADRRI